MRKQRSPRDDILDETVRLNSAVNGGVSSQNWEPGLIWFRVGKGSQTGRILFGVIILVGVLAHETSKERHWHLFADLAAMAGSKHPK